MTPKHATVCGDVIIAAAGTYGNQFNNTFGTVSNCPSKSGGIDGKGGVYSTILLCAGPYVTSCQVSNGSYGFLVEKSNWTIEGFDVVSSGPAAFMATCNGGWPCNAGTHTIAYVAFINDIALNAQQGFTPTDSGSTHGSTGQGVDEVAVVGSIAYNLSRGLVFPLAALIALDRRITTILRERMSSSRAIFPGITGPSAPSLRMSKASSLTHGTRTPTQGKAQS